MLEKNRLKKRLSHFLFLCDLGRCFSTLTTHIVSFIPHTEKNKVGTQKEKCFFTEISHFLSASTGRGAEEERRGEVPAPERGPARADRGVCPARRGLRPDGPRPGGDQEVPHTSTSPTLTLSHSMPLSLSFSIDISLSLSICLMLSLYISLTL